MMPPSLRLTGSTESRDHQRDPRLLVPLDDLCLFRLAQPLPKGGVIDGALVTQPERQDELVETLDCRPVRHLCEPSVRVNDIVRVAEIGEWGRGRFRDEGGEVVRLSVSGFGPC